MSLCKVEIMYAKCTVRIVVDSKSVSLKGLWPLTYKQRSPTDVRTVDTATPGGIPSLLGHL